MLQETGDWKVARTRRLESLRYGQARPAHNPFCFRVVRVFRGSKSFFSVYGYSLGNSNREIREIRERKGGCESRKVGRVCPSAPQQITAALEHGLFGFPREKNRVCISDLSV